MKRRVLFYATNPEHGVMSFYMDAGKGRVWMFDTTWFSDGIFSRFSGGRTVQEVVAEKDRNPRSMKLRDRLLRTLRYLEKEDC